MTAVRLSLLLLFLSPALACAQADSTLTLAAVEREALAHSPALLAATSATRAALARAEGGGAWDDPELSIELAPRTLGTPSPGYRVGVMQRIGAFGEPGARRLVAGTAFDVAASDEGAARLDLLRDARVAFAEYLRATRALAAHRTLADLAGELRRAALAKYAAGAVEQADPLAASVESARLTHHGVKIESELRIAIAQLNTLIGRPATAPLPPPSDETPETATTSSDLDSLVRLARAERPESQAAISRVAGRAAGARVAQLSGRPGLVLGVAYDRMWEDPAMRTQLELGVVLPLWGGAGARRAEAAAELAAAEAQQRALSLRIEREVVEAATRYDEAAHDLDVLDTGVLPIAAQGVSALRTAYEGNRASFQALLEATRTLAEARMDRIDAEARRAVARADLARALGADTGLVPMGDMR
jgi:cobalt-zinc-cadmium efflux system outer membrane protein